MQSTLSIISKLKTDFSQFHFKESDDFFWSPIKKTVYYNPKIENADILLLHEIAHALLGHSSFSSDISMIILERQAWDRAIELGSAYDIKIVDGVAQYNLDSYRDWLHKRSTCPVCTATGLQTKKQKYLCLACGNIWKVNLATKRRLHRYNLKLK